MPSLKGINCRIKNDGRICDEFGIESAKEHIFCPSSSDENSVDKYIRLGAGSSFEIEYFINKSTCRNQAWTLTGECQAFANGLSLDYVIDDVHFEGPALRLADDCSKWRTVSRYGPNQNNGVVCGQKLITAKVKSDECFPFAGSIKVIFKRGQWLLSSACHQQSISSGAFEQSSSQTESRLQSNESEAINRVLADQLPQQIHKTKIHRCVEIEEDPWASFTFKYRSRSTLERIGILPPLEHQDPTLLENDQLCEMVATYKRKIEELSQDKNEAPNRDQKDIKHHRARSSTPTVKPESEFREIIDLTQEFVLSLGKQLRDAITITAELAIKLIVVSSIGNRRRSRISL